ncbi:MAG: hypothetical protein WBC40_10295 [Halobacteriota archaeon]
MAEVQSTVARYALLSECVDTEQSEGLRRVARSLLSRKMYINSYRTLSES